MSTGIDAISVYIPKLAVKLNSDWAQTRAAKLNTTPQEFLDKISKGVGISEMSIVDAHEDAATMAAEASLDLLKKSGISLSQIGYIAVATETSVDRSKAISAYVLGMLEGAMNEKAPHLGAIEFKFACVSASYAVESAVSLIEADRISKKRPYALVIASDVAKYDLYSPGEYTQGAGAIAMLICKNPKLLSIDKGPMTAYTKDERDFFRPDWSPTPTVDGKYSINIYSECMKEALTAHLEDNRDLQISKSKCNVDHFLFHLPFPKMAQYALGPLLYPLYNEVDLTTLSSEEKKEALKNFAKSKEFTSFMEEKVTPSLTYSQKVGNIYTGSMYLGFASLLSNALNNNKELSGTKALFLSYGSGASAKVFTGTIMSGWKKEAAKLSTLLNDRTYLDLETYESLHDNFWTLKENNKKVVLGAPKILKSVKAAKGFALTAYGESATSEKYDLGYRYYKYIK